MKTKKLSVILLCLVLSLGMLTACGEKDPYAGLELYESDAGISIYMDKGFEEQTAEGKICAWQGEASGVACEVEKFTTLDTLGYNGAEMTVEEYTALILQAYQLNGEVLTDENGNTYITYVQDIMGQSVTYYNYFYKGSDSFWGVAFFCMTDAKAEMEEQFQLYASSVQIP